MLPGPEPPIVVLADGRDEDADHDVDGAEDGDGRTVVHAALPEVVPLLLAARRGGDGELHCIPCVMDLMLREVFTVWGGRLCERISI